MKEEKELKLKVTSKEKFSERFRIILLDYFFNEDDYINFETQEEVDLFIENNQKHNLRIIDFEQREIIEMEFDKK